MKYSEKNVNRLKLTYFTAGRRHTQKWNLGMQPGGGQIDDAALKIALLWNAIKPGMANDTKFEMLKYHPKGQSNGVIVDMPATLTDYAATVTGWKKSGGAKNLSVTGVSDTGLEGRQHFYGYIGVFSDEGSADLRYRTGEEAVIDTLIGLLTPNVLFTDLNGSMLAYRPYVNAGANAYHQRQIRVGQ